MSRDAGKDLLASPETEQLLSTDTNNASETKLQRWSTDKSYLQNDDSSSKPQDKSVGLNHNVQIGETSNNPVTVTALSSITVSGDGDDDPPPYSAIALPNHTGWPYGLFSFGNTDEATCRVQIPLTPFQASLRPPIDFHSQETSGQHALLPMTEQFFKLGCRSSFVPTPYIDNEITEKTKNKKSRRYGALLVAAAVIIFLMLLSLIVRFIMERSWWRK